MPSQYGPFLGIPQGNSDEAWPLYEVLGYDDVNEVKIDVERQANYERQARHLAAKKVS